MFIHIYDCSHLFTILLLEMVEIWGKRMKLDLCIVETSKHTNKHTNKFQHDWRPKCKGKVF